MLVKKWEQTGRVWLLELLALLVMTVLLELLLPCANPRLP